MNKHGGLMKGTQGWISPLLSNRFPTWSFR